MKALILYFSGTGNTASVAKLIAESLNGLDIETELHSSEENYLIKANTYDMLILGCPKYYEYPTFEFVDYIKKNLPVCSQIIPTMMFITQVGPLDTNFNGMKRLLAGKGHRLLIGKSFPFANNMMIFSFFSKTDDEKIKKNVGKIRSEIPPLVQDFVNGKAYVENIGSFKGAMEKLVAVLCTKLFPVFFMKYSVSEECTGCSLCEKKCPKGNIVMKSHRPVFGRHCMFCMRCINICPSNAILYNKKKCPQYKCNNIK